MSPLFLHMDFEGPCIRSPSSAPTCCVTLVRSPNLSVLFPTCKKEKNKLPDPALSSNSTSNVLRQNSVSWCLCLLAGAVPASGGWVASGLSHPLSHPGACSLLAECLSPVWTPRPVTCSFWMSCQWTGLATAGRAGAGSPVARQSPASLTGSTFTPTPLPPVPTGCGNLCLSIVSSSQIVHWTPMAT